MDHQGQFRHAALALVGIPDDEVSTFRTWTSSALWPTTSGRLTKGCPSAYIGGYVDDEVIESLAGQTLVVREMAGEIVIPRGKWYSHLEQEQYRLTSEWMSLAIFPLDDEFYYGSFAVRHDDLAAGRLDKAFSVTTFSE